MQKKTTPRKKCPKLVSRLLFYKRLLRNLVFGLLMIASMLFIGMIGYHSFEELPWTDSFLDASMILSGMGPVSKMQTSGGKIFSGIYALLSGIFFLITIAVVFAPLIHRFFTAFHLAKEK